MEPNVIHIKELTGGRIIMLCLPRKMTIDQSRQHCEIALIEHRAAVPMDIAPAGSPLLLGATVLRHRDT
jgi:hypothetical protein